MDEPSHPFLLMYHAALPQRFSAPKQSVNPVVFPHLTISYISYYFNMILAATSCFSSLKGQGPNSTIEIL